MSLPTGDWNYPTTIKAGPGRIGDLPQHCRAAGMSAPLLVTDPGLSQQPMVLRAIDACRSAGLRIACFDGIKGNPTSGNVADGVAVLREGGHDGVIAFGGGSALDAGKAIALMAHQTGALWDYEDVGTQFERVDVAAMVPVIAVPTTSGTGSEVGRASVITDETAHRKRFIFHPKMLPGLVILDPELTVGLPVHLTAATGMDALSHNLEAYCAPGFHPMASGIALEAMRLISIYLPRAVENGQDLEARYYMLVASAMGATAFQRGLGAMHALAHPLGARYDAHHGLLNAILMPYVLQVNREAIEAPLARLARHLRLNEESSQGVIDWVIDLRRRFGIAHTLAEIDIAVDAAAAVGEEAAADPSAASNPVDLGAARYRALFEDAVHGRLERQRPGI